MSEPVFDARELRNVLSVFVTGVTVITTVDASGKAYGLTANSFSSVSLDPPLILWSQSLNAASFPVFRDAAHFAVSILADDQVEISNGFAKGSPDKFADVRTRPGLNGIPLIEDCAATLECTKVTSYPGGDHVVFLGRVERINRSQRRPLAFSGGKYVIAHPHDLDLKLSQARSIAELQAVRMATQAIVDLSDELDETVGLGVWGNKGPTIVRWEESRQPLSENLRTGLVLPVLKSSTGLAFAAHLPHGLVIDALENEFSSQQLPQSAAEATLDQLDHHMAEIRHTGFSRLHGSATFSEWYGGEINAISAPVFARDGQMVLALTIIGSADKLDVSLDANLAKALGRTARMLSTRLGYLEGNKP